MTGICYTCREMKFYAFILLVSMLGLNLSSFTEAFKRIAQKTEICCETDECCLDDQGCKDHHECENEQQKNEPCRCGCDCHISIQIVAINHHLPTPDTLIPMEHLFVSRDISYKSEYLNILFQPPRIA